MPQTHTISNAATLIHLIKYSNAMVFCLAPDVGVVKLAMQYVD